MVVLVGERVVIDNRARAAIDQPAVHLDNVIGAHERRDAVLQVGNRGIVPGHRFSRGAHPRHGSRIQAALGAHLVDDVERGAAALLRRLEAVAKRARHVAHQQHSRARPLTRLVVESGHGARQIGVAAAQGFVSGGKGVVHGHAADPRTVGALLLLPLAVLQRGGQGRIDAADGVRRARRVASEGVVDDALTRQEAATVIALVERPGRVREVIQAPVNGHVRNSDWGG